MNGFDCQRWEYCKIKAKENGLRIDISGDKFIVRNKKNGNVSGTLNYIDDLFSFLCGYEAGKNE
jgi:hypothetical protein